ncbi:aryl-alcohol-oxidase from pleurotus Eryingii [Mycena leptocephala]|nr:aryl-alcohol-oxidase from pleurotus Eryingii [Mycena leptocephala]
MACSMNDLKTYLYKRGTAGNVVANRLTEDADVRVLVLEAGGSDKDAYNSHVPLYGRRLQGSQYDWNFTTTPQAALNERAIPYPRGLSSMSAHLMLMASLVRFDGLQRGPSEDWDRMARVTGDSGWTWGNIQPYIRKVHSFNGVNSVSLSGWQYSSDPRALEAIAQSNGEFPFNEDMNSGFQLGLTTVGDGTRSSSATSYLGAKYIKRNNLYVLLHARVLRLKRTNTKITQMLAVSASIICEVKFLCWSGDTTMLFKRPRRSFSLLFNWYPTILMLSGLGIPLNKCCRVGKNLTDHPLLVTVYNANTTDTPDDILRNATFAKPFERRWNETKTGPLSSGQGRILGWFRFNLSSPVFGGVPDPAAGPNSAHYEMIIGNGAGSPPPTGHYLGLTLAVVAPTSTGSLTLNSSNPLDSPLINRIKRFLSAAAWDGYVLSPTVNVTDDNLDDFIRNNTGVIWHPVKTAAMSARGADYGVVDPDLKVKGLDGLRIVDASVLPFIPSAHTQVPTYIIAERASDLIKQDIILNKQM